MKVKFFVLVGFFVVFAVLTNNSFSSQPQETNRTTSIR